MKLVKFLLGLIILPILFGFSNIAHRGDNEEGKYVEHTYEAYDRAVASDANYLELDIHRTKDGVLVVSHDNNISRVFGVDKLITSTPYDTLKKYRNHANEPVHTLADVFNRYRSVPGLKFMIETKNETSKTGMEPELIDLIKKYHLSKRVLIESYSVPSLTKVKEIDPQIVTCLLGNKYTQVGNNDYYANGEYSEKIAKYLKDHHKKYLIWDVDTKTQMKKLLKNKLVSGVLTNYPAKLAKVKKEKKYPAKEINGRAYIVAKKAQVYKEDQRTFKKTNKKLKQESVYRISKVKFSHNRYWYCLGENDWVQEKNIEFYPFSPQAKLAPKLKVGILQVTKTTKIFSSPGQSTNKIAAVKSQWGYFSEIMHKKHIYYNLGNNNWIDGKDVKVIK